MRLPFAARLAWREGRSSVRRVGVYMGSITLGVTALVAIHSFRGDVARAVDRESRSILGADLRLGRTTPLSDTVRAIADSLVAEGARAAEVTTLVSMVLAERSGSTRLLQVRGVEGPYPFYGTVQSDPPGGWEALADGQGALVDAAVLPQLDARVGDTLSIGSVRIPIRATVSGLPTDLGFQAAVGPRVFVSREVLEATGLLTFGSLARYRLFLELPEGTDAEELEGRYTDVFDAGLVSVVSAREQADALTEGVGVLTRFLGLIGLAALLLGGIGVASAIHVYVKEKLTTVAVLRCLGAGQRSVFAAYLLQAAALGLVGALLGVGVGLVVQRLLPGAIDTVLPVPVTPAFDGSVAITGLGLGVWVAVMFALLPLLDVRDVPPLRALRQSVEPHPSRGRRVRALAVGVLLLSVVLMSVWQSPTPGIGLAFAGGLGVTLLVLWGLAAVLVRGTRALRLQRAGYPVRQGLSNLFRPRNQTVALTLGLGFGVFVIATVLGIQHNLRRELSFDVGASQPNLLFFDIQRDQADDVLRRVSDASAGDVELTPIVPSRIAAINGRSAAQLLADSAEGGPENWAVRRVYRNSYRAELADSETVSEGDWFDEAPADPDGVARISLEVDVARDLAVRVGDQITWDVQGTVIPSRVASLRTVDWARFAPNFFVLFEPGALEEAPQTLLAFTRVESVERRARLQTELVRAHPNVSVLDLATVQETLDRILGTISRAIAALAAFAVVGGLIVLVGTLATSRYQRVLEGALLRTLGGRRGQILQVFLTEYATLGLLAAAAGTLLGLLASWAVVRWSFEAAFKAPLFPLAVLTVGCVGITAIAGMAMSRGILTRAPLQLLRATD